MWEAAPEVDTQVQPRPAGHPRRQPSGVLAGTTSCDFTSALNWK